MNNKKLLAVAVVVVFLVVGISVGLYFLLKKKESGSVGGAFAFACSPGVGCHKVNQAPNKASGLYSDVVSCNAGCPPAPSPKPVSKPTPSSQSPGDIIESCYLNVMKNATSKDTYNSGMKCCNLFTTEKDKYYYKDQILMCYVNSDEFKNCVPQIAKALNNTEENARSFLDNLIQSDTRSKNCGICDKLVMEGGCDN